MAFSLVEVVVAIGVVAFAVLAIVSMLPVGLKNVNRAENLQATGNIATQLRGQMQLLSFSPTNTDFIQNLNTTTNYFTLDGIQTNSASAFYTASFTVTSNTSFSTNNARTVTVTLTYPPGAQNKTNTFSLVVARQTDQ